MLAKRTVERVDRDAVLPGAGFYVRIRAGARRVTLDLRVRHRHERGQYDLQERRESPE